MRIFNLLMYFQSKTPKRRTSRMFWSEELNWNDVKNEIDNYVGKVCTWIKVGPKS